VSRGARSIESVLGRLLRGSLLVAAVFHDACKSDASAPSCFGQQGQLLRHSRPSLRPFSRATGLRVAANFGVAVRAPARQPTAPATGSLQRPVRRRSLRPRASPPLPGGEAEAVVCLVPEISIEYL